MYLLENGEMLQSFEGSRSHIEATNSVNVNAQGSPGEASAKEDKLRTIQSSGFDS